MNTTTFRGPKTRALCAPFDYIIPVSATDIIKELPRLTEQERRAIRQVLLDIANQDEDIATCNEAALQGAMMLDRLENSKTVP
jgi:hypothetical protein